MPYYVKRKQHDEIDTVVAQTKTKRRAEEIAERYNGDYGSTRYCVEEYGPASMSEQRLDAATEAAYDYEVRVIGFTGDKPTKHHRAIAAAILTVADEWVGK